MRKIKEVLRLKFGNHLAVRQIGESFGIGKSTVQEYFDRAQKADLTWPLAPKPGDAALENLLFPPHDPFPQENRQMPPMEEIHREKKRKGVTLQLLWHEYKEGNPEGYQYSQFCELYRQWLGKLDVCLRQRGNTRNQTWSIMSKKANRIERNPGCQFPRIHLKPRQFRPRQCS